MNYTEYENLSKEKLLEMYDELFDYAKGLEEKVEELQSKLDDLDTDDAYDEGFAEGKHVGYAEGLDDGYENYREEVELRQTEQAR